MPTVDILKKPFFTTPEINKPLILGEAESQIGKDCAGRCSFEYKWLPSPAIRFTLRSNKLLDSVALPIASPIESTLIFPPGSAETPVRIQSISKTDEGYEYNGFLSITDIELKIPVTSTECDLTLIHFPNYIGFGFGPIGLECDEWEITINIVENMKYLIKQLSEQNGYAITQFGIIKRRDGKPFDMVKAQDILYPLRDLLSFVEGAWCAPLFPIGLKDGQIAWIIYQNTAPSTWLGGHKLITSMIDLMEMNLAFKNLVEIRANDISRAIRLGTAIGIYIEACHAITQPTAIILIQSALELLISLYVEDHNIDVLEDFWRKKSKCNDDAPASLMLKWLLENLSISLDLPCTLKNLHKYRGKFESLKKASGPEIFTFIRNGFIHPTTKNMKRAISLEVEDIPAISDAASLGKEYLALVLLRFLGYSGNYTSWLDNTIKPVPWADKPQWKI